MASGVQGVGSGAGQGLGSAKPGSLGAPGTPGSGGQLPQEIKIQIKLPKPGTPISSPLGGVVQPLIGQPAVQFAGQPISIAMDTGAIKVDPVFTRSASLGQLGTPGQLSALGQMSASVQSGQVQTSPYPLLSRAPADPLQTTPSKSNKTSGGSLTIKEEDQNPDGNVIKQLLLKGRRKSVQSSASLDTPTVVIDPPKEDRLQAIPSAARLQSTIGSFGTAGSTGTRLADMRSLSDTGAGSTQMAAPTTPLTPKSREVSFSAYDPNTPPKRGRPKGTTLRSKSEGLISPLGTFLSDGPPTSGLDSLGGIKLSNVVAPSAHTAGSARMKMSASSSASMSTPPVNIRPKAPPSPQGQRPQLKLMIPPPGTAQSQALGGASPHNVPLIASPSIQSPLLTPDGTPLVPTTPTTPSQLAKLKLKGKLLMKRSMSVERMLEQQRLESGQTPGTPGMTGKMGSPIGLPPGLTSPFNKTDLLQRSASVDESRLAFRRKQLSLGDSISDGQSPAVDLTQGPHVFKRTPSTQASPSKMTPSKLIIDSTPRGKLQRAKSIHEEPMEISQVTPSQSQPSLQSKPHSGTDPRSQPSDSLSLGLTPSGRKLSHQLSTNLPSLPSSSFILNEKTQIQGGTVTTVDLGAPVNESQQVCNVFLYQYNW